jgi:formate hydrogenlyase subunit 6/NADH:ubiquinone oxidoreductase subunit I
MNANRELPVLNASLCTGCGDCVVVCPTQCLAMADTLPWLPRPADCIACKACELICPTDAIQVLLVPGA